MNLKEITCPFPPNAKAYRSNGGLHILVSIDNTKHGKLKHVSVSRIDMYPSWDEILRVKEHFFGDIDCMMVLPKKEDYVNVHNYCFHIWQCPERWDMR